MISAMPVTNEAPESARGVAHFRRVLK